MDSHGPTAFAVGMPLKEGEQVDDRVPRAQRLHATRYHNQHTGGLIVQMRWLIKFECCPQIAYEIKTSFLRDLRVSAVLKISSSFLLFLSLSLSEAQNKCMMPIPMLWCHQARDTSASGNRRTQRPRGHDHRLCLCIQSAMSYCGYVREQNKRETQHPDESKQDAPQRFIKNTESNGRRGALWL